MKPGSYVRYQHTHSQRDSVIARIRKIKPFNGVKIASLVYYIDGVKHHAETYLNLLKEVEE